jgi:hypothetical protein
MVQYLTGDYRTASAGLKQALKLHRDLVNRIGEAEVLNTMGELAQASSATTEAQDLHHDALAIATEIASPLQEARAMEGIAQCLLQGSQPRHGDVLLQRALAIYQRIGSPHAERVATFLRQRGR